MKNIYNESSKRTKQTIIKMKNKINKSKEKNCSKKTPKEKIDYFIDALTGLLYVFALYLTLKHFFTIDISNFSSENISSIKEAILPSDINPDNAKMNLLFIIFGFFASKTIFDSIVRNSLSAIFKKNTSNAYEQ